MQLQKGAGAGVTAASRAVAPVLAAAFSSAAPAAETTSSAAPLKLTYKKADGKILPYDRTASHVELPGLPASHKFVPATPAAGHTDSQGPPESTTEGPLALENFGRYEPYYAQRAAIAATIPLPAKVNSTARDTLFTYSTRVYKASLRSMRSMYAAQVRHRQRVVRQIAQHEYDIIQAQKAKYRAWKQSQKEAGFQREAERFAKRAAERAASLERGNALRAAYEAKMMAQQVAKTGLLLDESQHWITDPMDVKNAIFDTVASVPTGWWPQPKYSVDPAQKGFDERLQLTQADLDYLRTVHGKVYPHVEGQAKAAAAGSGDDAEAGDDNSKAFLTGSEDERAHFDSRPPAFAVRPALVRSDDEEKIPTGTVRF